MGIWLELLVRALSAYVLGIGCGALLWHRPQDAGDTDNE